MRNKEQSQNVVYFPETDEKFHIVLIKGEDGKVRETLVTPEEFREIEFLQSHQK
jgi:hypothetical protein